MSPNTCAIPDRNESGHEDVKIESCQWLKRASLVLCAGLMLSACAAGAVYRPQGSEKDVGYSDQQITLTRYRVSFSGDPDTSRAQVED